MGGQSGTSNQFRTNMRNHRYRYRVETWQVLLPGQEPIDMIPTAIQHIFLTQLYDEAIHPILEIKTLLPPRLHEAIVNNKNEVNIRFRMVAVDINGEQGTQPYHDIINDTFIVLIDDEAPFQESKLSTKPTKHLVVNKHLPLLKPKISTGITQVIIPKPMNSHYGEKKT